MFLTPVGEGMVEQILPIFESIYRDLEEYLGQAQLSELYRVLDEVNAKLGALATEEEIHGGQGKRKIYVKDH